MLLSSTPFAAVDEQGSAVVGSRRSIVALSKYQQVKLDGGYESLSKGWELSFI
jgi:hypothetical protein